MGELALFDLVLTLPLCVSSFKSPEITCHYIATSSWLLQIGLIVTVSWQWFFKNLFHCRVVSLLQNGAIMNKVFQPHEAHIPYLLQVNYYLIVLIALFNFHGLKLALFEKFAGLQQNI